MMNKLKSHGLILFMALALTALWAPGASAATNFTSEAVHTTLVGSQVGTDVFTTNAGGLKCNEVTYSGTSTSAAASELSVTPTYTECTAFGFINPRVDTNGCSYEYTAAATSALHIVCPTSPIAITVFNCVTTIPGQTVSGGITYDNEGSGKAMDFKITINLTGITYIQHSISFPGCSTAGTEVATSLFHDGKWTGETTLRGLDTEGVQVAITVS